MNHFLQGADRLRFKSLDQRSFGHLQTAADNSFAR
jgi:hypothetical protein